ncbi:DUF7344 domain-containing protein [Haladaptatus caseinilyticus]|uniref:DUF7344 domain-containing protein n=1 Tax=Haladaptatus caseinilyticus TaxID=2993314 RepID=UPI00224B0561|nr:ArsR family transcriptional regulator [Haladaptatus caseinilyticus]
MSQQTAIASLDASLSALNHPYRRRLLLAVQDENPYDYATLTEADIVPDGGETDEPDAVTTQLHHLHLPKLADHGYIEWQPDTETIRQGSNFEKIAPLLTLLSDHADELPHDWP